MSQNSASQTTGSDEDPAPSPLSWLWVALAWTAVGIPLAWGIFMTVQKAVVLFR